jgi:hypothetical protein
MLPAVLLIDRTKDNREQQKKKEKTQVLVVDRRRGEKLKKENKFA